MTKKVFLDCGHGGTDGGAAANGLVEKDLTLEIAKRTRDYLINGYEDVEVKLSRETDKAVSLRERTNEANAWKANVLVSIHINSHTNKTANGYEDYIYTDVSDKTIAFQNTIHAAIRRFTPEFEDRGKKRANFHMLRESNMSAVLTENGFIVNGNDASRLKDQTFLYKIAAGHAEGIAEFLGLNKKSEKEQPPAAPKKLYRVQVGAFENKANAEKLINDLHKQGYKDAFINEQ